MNIDSLHKALRFDAFDSSSAPIRSEQTGPPSAIIYDKAGSVIRMFQHSVGDTLFRAALNEYLTTK